MESKENTSTEINQKITDDTLKNVDGGFKIYPDSIRDPNSKFRRFLDEMLKKIKKRPQ